MVFAITIPYLEELIALPGGDITAFLVLLVALALAFQIVLALVLKILSLIVGKTKTTLDDRVLRVLGSYMPYIAFFTALFIAFETIYPEVVLLENFTEFDIYIIVMLGLGGLLLASLSDAVLVWYGMEIRPRKKAVREEEVFPFVRNIIKLAIVLVFFVFMLQKAGFDTTAIITGLGIGGLAVALALQDTLSNFFAGVHILVDKPFKEDDYIRLESGVEGSVKQIGWRTTRLVTLAQNELVVPNTKLAGTLLENFSTPKELSGVYYQIGVDYKEDIDTVEKIIADALHRIAKKNPLMEESTIWVRFDSFGDYSLNFKFGYLVKGYVNRFGILKEVNHELFYSFKKHNINIPFPVRVVYKGEEKTKKQAK